MGAWGITVRQSDDGLDLLDTIAAKQLRKVNFTVFHVSEAITLLNQTIQEEIERYRRKPPSKITDFYISETLMHDFTNAAILVAECLYDYYQTGELVVYDYAGENYDPVVYHIKNFIVTGNDLPPLLAELESVQSPEHWKYQEWASEEILRQWLKHIQSVQQTLKEHLLRRGPNMADLQATLSEAVKLNRSIAQFLKFSTYTEYDDLSGLDIDFADGEQLLLWEELRRITDQLADVQEYISYLTRPITEVSRLRKGTAGKYWTAKGHYYDCRSNIEALVTDEYHDVPYWTRTTVEHNGTDYYLVGYKDIPMKGLRVRVRAIF